MKKSGKRGDTTATTSMSKAVVEVTNRRYQADCFWGGPKGLKYGLLVGALPIQQPVLYPDQGSTYFVGQFRLKKGWSLTLKGEYGHVRYFSYTVAAQLGGNQLGNGDFIPDDKIVPDKGSFNPFMSPDKHTSGKKHRQYTLQVVQGEPPSEKEPNTLYTSSDSEDEPIHLAIRHYIPDVGYDGTGNAKLWQTDDYGLPEVILNLADGTQLTGEAMAEAVQASKAREAAGYPIKGWMELVKNSADPVNAPAVPDPEFALQRFWNTDYSVTGLFIADQAERVQKHPADGSGGFANNPDTIYLSAPYSLDFGQVVVIKGKMPSHPNTRHQGTLELDTQVRYWSASSSATPASGVGWASIFDEEVPLDEDGNFTLVMSWAEDRPKNATKACGVKWIDFGGGEGHFTGARTWVNILYMRYMHPNPLVDWPQSPVNIPAPSVDNPIPQDSAVMQEYYPRSKYMSKADFEALDYKDGSQ